MSFCQFEGPPCFQHPNYVFYKSFKYKSENRNRVLASGDFFFLKILKEIPVCIGEIELLWKDVAANQFLASLKLYFRPEHTPKGRQDDAGEDEVIALAERLVVKLDDLVPLIQHDTKWLYGSPTQCSRGDRCAERNGDVGDGCESSHWDGGDCAVGCEDARNGQVAKMVNGRKLNIGMGVSRKGSWESHCDKTCSGAANLVVLSYPKYCRYRAMQKRLEGCENEWLHLAVVVAIGGVSGKSPDCRVMFCRDTFNHAYCDDLGIKMDHMLPVLKGRAKSKKIKQVVQKDVQQEVQKDVQQEIKKEVQQDVKQEVQQEIKKDVQQEIKKDVRQEVKKDVQKEIKKDIQTEVKKDVQKEAKKDVQQEVKKDIQKEVKKETQNETDTTEEHVAHAASVALPVTTSSRPRRSTESSDINEEKVSTEEQAFLIGLHKFMHDAKMPIGRIPSLGFKQIDLYFFYKQAEKLGGYDSITSKRMWKHLYDKLGGNQSNTSAATCTRRHYERLLLPYERHLRKPKIIKTKKKVQKLPKTQETDIKQEETVDNKESSLKEEVEVKLNIEVKLEVGEPEKKEIMVVSSEDPQKGRTETIVIKDKQKPAVTEHSKPEPKETCEVMEIPTVKQHVDNNDVVATAEVKAAEGSNNFQHFPFVQVDQLHPKQTVKTPTSLAVLPSGVLLSGESPTLPYATNMVYRHGYLVPAIPQILHTPWAVVSPVMPPSSPSASSSQTRGDGALPHQAARETLIAPLPSSSKTNQNSVPCSVSSQDIGSTSSGKLPLSSQIYQQPSASRTVKMANAELPHKSSSAQPNDQVQPAHQISKSSQLFTQNEFLSSSSQNLALLLHPLPVGHRRRPHLPPAPPAIYLHPLSTNQMSLLQSPVTFPAPSAHCYPRKRMYPFEIPSVSATGAFPSPDIVLDRIRNSTGLPRSNLARINPSCIRQQFEDPRNIFRHTLPPATTNLISSPSPRKQSLLQLEKQPGTKSKNSGRKSQQAHTVYGQLSTRDLHQTLLQQENAVPSSIPKVVDQMKASGNLNGFLSPQHPASKSLTSVPLASPLPSSSKDGRLASALFGEQFTALPRAAKPSDLPPTQSLIVDPSSAAAAAITLNPHLHPAFTSPFLQHGAAAASSAFNPQLQMLASAYISPAQLSAYEEMLRQNGYGTFLAAAAQRKGSKKN